MSLRRRIFLYFLGIFYVEITERMVIGKFTSMSPQYATIQYAVENNSSSVSIVIMYHNHNHKFYISTINNKTTDTYQDNREGKLYDCFKYFLVATVEKKDFIKLRERMQEIKESFDSMFKKFVINYKKVIILRGQ